jgi:DNA-binding MarR family transcriptional regulator
MTSMGKRQTKTAGSGVALHERKSAEDILAGTAPADILRRFLKLENRIMAPFTDHIKKRYRISLNEFRLLMLIGRLEVTASHELAEVVGVNSMMVSRGIAVLERHGRIKIDLDPRNMRRKVLRLTAKGRTLYEQMKPHSDELATYMLEGMTVKEIQAFDGSVIAITKRLEAIDQEGRSIFLQRTTAEAGSKKTRRS